MRAPRAALLSAARTTRTMRTTRDDRGQTMAEYGMILGGIAVIVATVVVLLGPPIGNLYQQAVDAF